jgi:PAS domain S-box-containing protein
MRTGKKLTQKETMIDMKTGKIKHFTAIKAPLLDDDAKTIGLVITMSDITSQKEVSWKKNARILEYLEIVTPLIQLPIYWEDLDNVILGGNETVVKGIGALSKEELVGKTAYDLYPKEMAEHIIQHNELVMRTGKIMSQEEAIEDIATGAIKYFLAFKSPICDDNGNIIGIVGTSIDITAEKETERLKIENAVHRNLVQEQEKFVKIANQVAHDIRSPLASLLMIVKSCAEIPEADRIALREAVIGIGDIANHLLNQYQKKEPDSGMEERQAILVSANLLQLLTEKKYQYQNVSIKFDHDFSQNSHFAFIKIIPSAFKRMMSNLIDNAMDSFNQNKGKINLKLDADDERVRIVIQDNGKGMPAEIVNKIMNNIAVTSGKKSGHGIGLTQVRETLQHNQGEMSIDSKPEKGTKIVLTFPKIETPYWIAEEIILGKQDIVVILDDDTSIHRAWDSHFEPIFKEAAALELHHFTMGTEALQFIENLPENQKRNVFLLTDYELLKQELNGLQVIAKSGVKRSILVTSHYAQQIIQNQAAKTGTKILPKQLASEIPIKISEVVEEGEKKATVLKSVDLVVVDDDKTFVQNLLKFISPGRTVDKYYDPYHFLENLSQYAKDTKIFLDNNFIKTDLRGLDMAKNLHEQGFTRLYILSGEVLDKTQIPDYVTVIRKDDLDTLQKI